MWCPWILRPAPGSPYVGYVCFLSRRRKILTKPTRVSTGLLQVNGWRSKPRSTPVHVLLPHEVIHCLATKSAWAFQSLMLGDFCDDSRRHFWNVIKDLEPWKNHPIHTSDALYHRLIPCCIHADGAQFYREDEFYVWSWSSIWGGKGLVQDVLLYKWPVAIIPERHMRSASVTCSSFFESCALYMYMRYLACLYLGSLHLMGSIYSSRPRLGKPCTRRSPV